MENTIEQDVDEKKLRESVTQLAGRVAALRYSMAMVKGRLAYSDATAEEYRLLRDTLDTDFKEASSGEGRET